MAHIRKESRVRVHASNFRTRTSGYVEWGQVLRGDFIDLECDCPNHFNEGLSWYQLKV